MTEKAELYRAVSEIAALLRETTQKVFNTETDSVEYSNTIFSKEEIIPIKRKFLKIVGEL